MRVVNHVYPTAEQIMPLAGADSRQPIFMVNLLKFRDRAAYPDGLADDISGREAYTRYAREMTHIVERGGGRLVFSGDVRSVVIGEVEDVWDAVAVVEYPSGPAFHALATSPEVQAIGIHREAGLAGQLLLLSVTLDLTARS